MDNLFAERFKSARVMNGLSLQEVSSRLENKISLQTLHKYEKGEAIPDSRMIHNLCQVFGVKPDYFFRETKVELGELEFRKLNKFFG
jgi:transcriptional regulator with XRE-family HTH domain